jgi:hypothetical protein
LYFREVKKNLAKLQSELIVAYDRALNHPGKARNRDNVARADEDVAAAPHARLVS